MVVSRWKAVGNAPVTWMPVSWQGDMVGIVAKVVARVVTKMVRWSRRANMIQLGNKKCDLGGREK